MITIAGNRKIGYGISTTITALGGTAPYTFSLVSGDGSITPQGVYTAPENRQNYQKPVRPKLKVVDSTPVTPEELTFEISVMSPLSLIGDIISEFMGFDVGQVMIYNQKYNIPQDVKPYVAINFVSNKPYANTKRHETINGQFCSVQEINNSATVDLDFLCRTVESLERKEEILLALKSDYSINQQAFNSFNIATLPMSFINLTTEEGPALLYRFKISIALQYSIRRVRAVAYYDQFRDPEFLIDS